MIQMAALKQILGMAVIRHQQSAAQGGGSHRRQEVGQVLGQAALADHHRETQTQLLLGFGERCALMVGADARQAIGIQVFPGKEGGVAVHRPPGKQGDFLKNPGVPGYYAGKVHDFRQSQDPGMTAVRRQIGCFQGGP
jgi:hypothetical protein